MGKIVTHEGFGDEYLRVIRGEVKAFEAGSDDELNTTLDNEREIRPNRMIP